MVLLIAASFKRKERKNKRKEDDVGDVNGTLRGRRQCPCPCFLLLRSTARQEYSFSPSYQNSSSKWKYIHVYFYRYGFLADLGNMERDKPTCGSEWREAKSIMIRAACGRFMVHLLHHAFWQRATKEVSQ